MSIYDKIFATKELIETPPVLVDIGASGVIHPLWKPIAKYSICIAFDADDREFKISSSDNKGFKKLHIFNCIVTDNETEKCEFFLTKSPFCSSSLKPDSNALSKWGFADKFTVTGKATLKNISLKKAIESVNLDRIDWFKTDSQGIDFRLFQNIYNQFTHPVLAAEFEPGIIDAYKGEDKLFKVLEFMTSQSFLLSNMVVKGSQRINNSTLDRLSKGRLRNLFLYSNKTSPGWAEITYVKEIDETFSKRSFLLTWVFADILNQNGLAFELASKGAELFNDTIFNEMASKSLHKLKSNFFKLRFIGGIFEKIGKLIYE